MSLVAKVNVWALTWFTHELLNTRHIKLVPVLWEYLLQDPHENIRKLCIAVN